MRQQQRQRKLDLANIPNVFVILTKTFLCTISFGGTYSWCNLKQQLTSETGILGMRFWFGAFLVMVIKYSSCCYNFYKVALRPQHFKLSSC